MPSTQRSDPDRIKAVRRLLKRNRLGAALYTDPVDCRYLSGFSATSCVNLITAKRALLCTDFRYEEAARRFCRHHSAWTFALVDTTNYSWLRPLVKPGTTMAVQGDRLTVAAYHRINRTLRGIRLKPLGGELSDIGTVKDAGEIVRIRKAASMADRALEATLSRLKAGMTEQEAAALLEEQCRRQGSHGPAFETIVLFGERCSLPHGVPGGRRRLRRGDFVLFDFGCTREGLRSDMTRTVVFGKAASWQRRIHDIVRMAQEAGRKSVRAGQTAGSVDATVRGYIVGKGYGKYFGHATGHGVGYRIHEQPGIKKGNTALLVPGMVVTVEPGIYLPGKGGVRIEDMVVVGQKKSRLLTHSPRHLREIDG